MYRGIVWVLPLQLEDHKGPSSVITEDGIVQFQDPDGLLALGRQAPDRPVRVDLQMFVKALVVGVQDLLDHAERITAATCIYKVIVIFFRRSSSVLAPRDHVFDGEASVAARIQPLAEQAVHAAEGELIAEPILETLRVLISGRAVTACVGGVGIVEGPR